jgi:hypothetical protein
MWLELLLPSSWIRNLPMRPRRFWGENPHRRFHVALREVAALRRFKNLMKKNAGKLKFSGSDE